MSQVRNFKTLQNVVIVGLTALLCSGCANTRMDANPPKLELSQSCPVASVPLPGATDVDVELARAATLRDCYVRRASEMRRLEQGWSAGVVTLAVATVGTLIFGGNEDLVGGVAAATGGASVSRDFFNFKTKAKTLESGAESLRCVASASRGIASPIDETSWKNYKTAFESEIATASVFLEKGLPDKTVLNTANNYKLGVEYMAQIALLQTSLKSAKSLMPSLQAQVDAIKGAPGTIHDAVGDIAKLVQDGYDNQAADPKDLVSSIVAASAGLVTEFKPKVDEALALFDANQTEAVDKAAEASAARSDNRNPAKRAAEDKVIAAVDTAKLHIDRLKATSKQLTDLLSNNQIQTVNTVQALAQVKVCAAVLGGKEPVKPKTDKAS